MRYIQVEQGSQEWHDLRSRSIGGSDVPILMGESKWGKTPYMLYREKTGLSIVETNPAMLRGIRLEPEARRMAEDRLGPLVPVVVQHDDHEWAIASLDGITLDDYPVEIKCPGQKDQEYAKRGQVPPHYKGQLQQALWITKAPVLYYISYDGLEIIIIEVQPDKEYQMAMFRAEKEFAECLLERRAPPFQAEDYAPIPEESEIAHIAAARKQKKLEAKRIADEIAALDEQLINEASRLGRGLKGCGLTVFQTCTNTLDRQALSKDYDIEWSRYMKKSPQRWQVRG